jgi:hypothetical protein
VRYYWSATSEADWKMYYTMSQPGGAGWLLPLISYHFTLVQNIKRDQLSVTDRCQRLDGDGGRRYSLTMSR